jgi:arginine/lysine/ornithine decarboxylase
MGSLDLARRKLHVEGEAAFTDGLQAVQYFNNELLKLPCFERLQLNKSDNKSSEYTTLDPFKISLWDRTGTLSGYALQEALEQEGCYAEMADPKHVVLAFSLASTIEDAVQLVKGLMNSAKKYNLLVNQTERVEHTPIVHSYNKISSPVSFGLHAQGDLKSVAVSDAAHALCAEMIIPYPPGIPILYPGERIEPEMVDLLKQLILSKAKFQGIIGELYSIKVIEERGE